MTRTPSPYLALALGLLAVATTASAQMAPPQVRIGADNAITAVYAETPPRIDGVIDDAKALKAGMINPAWLASKIPAARVFVREHKVDVASYKAG